MRIEAYSQVSQVYQSQKTAKNQRSAGVSHSDKLQISSFGKDIQSAKAAVAGTPDVRAELTAPIKTRIQEGTYEVSHQSFAEKLISKYEER